MHRLLRWFSLGLCVIGFLLISTLIYAQDGEEGDLNMLAPKNVHHAIVIYGIIINHVMPWHCRTLEVRMLLS